MINLCLYREFLEFFDLDFTLAVFDPETNIGKDFRYRGRSKLIDALGLTELVDTKLPLLNEIMRLSKVSVLKSESPTPTEISVEDENTSNQTSLAEDPSRGDPPHKLRNRETNSEDIQIHLFPGRLQDPDPPQNEMDPKHSPLDSSKKIYSIIVFTESPPPPL